MKPKFQCSLVSLRPFSQGAALLLFLAFLPMAVEAKEPKNWHKPSWKEAFSALDAGKIETAQTANAVLSKSILQEVIRAEILVAQAQPDFTELLAFFRSHTDWPQAEALKKKIEQNMPASLSDKDIVAWFKDLPAETAAGASRHIRALQKLQQPKEAQDIAQKFWRDGAMGRQEQEDFLQDFSELLSRDDHEARLRRLLWAEQRQAAERLFPLVSKGQRALALARLGLAEEAKGIEALLAKVPQNLQQDPGLLYERTRWRRRAGLHAGAQEILSSTPPVQEEGKKWWVERRIQIRELMETKKWREAYRLAAKHGLAQPAEAKSDGPKSDGQKADWPKADWAEAEFMAGWLALRQLDKAEQAAEHFANMLNIVSMPISRARAHFWLGHAQVQLGNEALALQSFQQAATHPTSFYGQLALAEIGDAGLVLPVNAAIEEERRRSFLSHPLIRASKALLEIGEIKRAEAFYRAAMKIAAHPADFVLLAQASQDMRRPDWAVLAAKEATKKGFAAPQEGWPLLSLRLPNTVDGAFIHALIRQESGFREAVVSPAGAAGLMQLMPATARAVAQKANIHHRERDLFDPAHNVRLGTLYIQERLAQFDGNKMLALAAYNAGRGRVLEWLKIFGDPRNGSITALDWLEFIPFSETRNYVQRILENTQIYRLRMGQSVSARQIWQTLQGDRPEGSQ